MIKITYTAVTCELPLGLLIVLMKYQLKTFKCYTENTLKSFCVVGENNTRRSEGERRSQWQPDVIGQLVLYFHVLYKHTSLQ